MPLFERVRVPAHVDQVMNRPGERLDTATRAYFEPKFGFDFGAVRVHADSAAQSSARGLDAAAYTVGSHIVLDPAAAPRHALAHELAHVVQQSHGQTGDAAGAEREAHAATSRLATGRSARVAGPAGAAVQCLPRVSTWERAAAEEPGAATKGQPPPQNPWERAKAAKPEDPATAQQHREREAEHLKRQAAVYAVVDDARREAASGATPSPDRKLLANSAEWIAARRLDLIVLTQTHDGGQRAPDFGSAYFDATVAYPQTGGRYPAAPTTGDDQLFYHKESLGGLARRHPRTQRLTLFVFPGSSDDTAELSRMIVHESQHLIDNSLDQAVVAQHKEKTHTAAPSDLSSLTIAYRREFRAFWMAGKEQTTVLGGGTIGDTTFGSADKPARNTDKVTHPLAGATGVGNLFDPVTTHFVNEKQENIFWHLVRLYRYGNPYATDHAFRKQVDAYDRPYTDNLVNSLRVDAVLTVLGWCNPTMTRQTPEVAKLFEKVRLLDATDRQFLSSADSREFWDRAKAALPAAVLTEFTAAVKGTP